MTATTVGLARDRSAGGRRGARLWRRRVRRCCAGCGCARPAGASSAACGSRRRTRCSAPSSPSSAAAARWGLGTYLLGSLGRADPPRLWGIGLVATAIAGIAYGIVALIAPRVTGASRAVTIAADAVPATSRRQARGTLALITVAAVLVARSRCGGCSASLRPVADHRQDAMRASSTISSSSPASAEAQARCSRRSPQTLPVTILGMAAGLGFAFLLAVLGAIRPAIVRALHADRAGQPDHAARGADAAPGADLRPRRRGDPRRSPSR